MGFSRLGIVLLAASIAGNGCNWITRRSDFERDPLVMSHLTHNKNDPSYAGVENESADDQPPQGLAQSPSVSRKPPAADGYRHALFEENAPRRRSALHADDYSWLEGRLTLRTGKRAGWHVRYAPMTENDRFGGELLLIEHSQLKLMREGDRVHLEGKV